jgi:MSHA biogenesis protein MshM
MGKTTLLFEFLGRVRDRARTVFLFNTLCEPSDILSFILYDLGVTPAPSKVERHRQLNEILAAEARAGRRVLVVIDEAQNLSSRTLEAVRLLTNFETSRSKLMHVVLAGQPELADKLAAAEATQLFQRVSTLCRLTPFTTSDTGAYIAHRLKASGHTGGSLFTAGAIRLLSEASRGVPRIINTLSFNSLCLCCARGAKQVDRAMVAEAIADLRLPLSRQPSSVQQAGINDQSAYPSLKRLEVSLSPSKTAKYLVAASFVICAMLAGIYRWDTKTETRPPSSSPELVLASSGNSGTSKLTGTESAAQNQPPARTSGLITESLAPRSETQASAETRSSKITIVAGDTLEGIATEHLGTFDQAVLRQIQKLNPHITDPNHIESGSTIRLPGGSGPEKSIASTRIQP